jgi:hypothetical protein
MPGRFSPLLDFQNFTFFVYLQFLFFSAVIHLICFVFSVPAFLWFFVAGVIVQLFASFNFSFGTINVSSNYMLEATLVVRTFLLMFSHETLWTLSSWDQTGRSWAGAEWNQTVFEKSKVLHRVQFSRMRNVLKKWRNYASRTSIVSPDCFWNNNTKKGVERGETFRFRSPILTTNNQSKFWTFRPHSVTLFIYFSLLRSHGATIVHSKLCLRIDL